MKIKYCLIVLGISLGFSQEVMAQGDEALAQELRNVSNGLAKAQGSPAQSGSNMETLDHLVQTSSKVLKLLGNKSGMSEIQSANQAAQAGVALSNMVKHFRSIAQSSASGCKYGEVIKLGDEAFQTFNRATSYLNKRKGQKASGKDLKDVPMTNYVSNWINKTLTGNQDEQARMKGQQLIGQMEQACQTAVTLTDLRSQIHTISDAQRALTQTVAPMFKSFMVMQANNKKPIPGTDTAQGQAATVRWTVEFNKSVIGVPMDADGKEEARMEALNAVIKEASGTSQDVLNVLNSLNQDLLNYQKQLLVFASVRPVTENGQTTMKLACPEGWPSVLRPAQGAPGYDTWTPLPTFTEYNGRIPVVKSICGYVSPARALELTASIAAADAQLDALILKLNSVGTRVVATQTSGENIQKAKDEAMRRQSLRGF